MAEYVVTVGSEVQVNTTPDLDYPSNEGVVGITAQENGNYLVLYGGNNPANGGTDYYVRAYDEKGQPLGAPTRVPGGAGGFDSMSDAFAYDVTSLADGSYLVTHVQTQRGSGYFISAATFSAMGQLTGNRSFAEASENDIQDVAAAGLAGGGFVLAFTERDQDTGVGINLVTQVVNASGSAVGPRQTVATDVDSIRDIDLTASANGVEVVWTDESAETRTYHSRLLTTSGQAQGLELLIGSTSLAGPFALYSGPASVAALKDRSFVVVYPDADGSGTLAQRLDTHGQKLGGEIVVSASGVQPTVAALASGGFVVLTTTGDHVAQAFDANGIPIGGPTTVDPDATSDHAGFPSMTYVAGLSNGGYAIAYTNADTSGEYTGQTSGAATKVVALGFTDTGTAGSDFLEGTSGADTLSGAGGNDTLQGGGLDDFLDGGSGTDVAVFSGNIQQYVITRAANGDLIVDDRRPGSNFLAQPARPEGTDRLHDVEILQFAGTDFNVSGLNTSLVGTSASETLSGTVLSDSILGLGGDDTITGSYGEDTILGGIGNDSLNGVDGADSIEGGDGNDRISDFGAYADNTRQNVLIGGLGNDSIGGSGRLEGGDGDDVLFGQRPQSVRGFEGGHDNSILAVQLLGGSGNDRLDVDADFEQQSQGGGPNLLDGGDGADTINGAYEEDNIFGGAGNDTIWGRSGQDRIDAGSGDDVIRTGYDGFHQIVDGGEGRDRFVLTGAQADYQIDRAGATTTITDLRDITIVDAMTTLTNVETLVFSDGTLELQPSGSGVLRVGTAGSDLLAGSTGNDTLRGAGGDDDLRGGLGNDDLNGGLGNDTVNGGDGNDTVVGADGNDALSGGSGEDQLFGQAGNDTIQAGLGNDKLFGDAGNDQLFGQAGNDTVFGGAGADTLRGDEGNDRLFGDAGMDTLRGGAGDDQLTGGADADVFVFGAADVGQDRILDFTLGADRLDLRGLGLYAEADALSAATSDAAGQVVITVGAVSLTLEHLSIAQLQAGGDFLV
ncbi:calcium-binding protein [Methylobacterium sp. V23]|uniref:calcium-binding protein n=1 Tax=Methylobacterium sp. V23 TaxID=2044878 RepID=UPI000CDB2804|nr:calcium-binding protein [Methylobacterium sp. V23]POR39934.1 hypothetical protein CRT23_26720 [Methylobacterium sp. V23]